MVFILQLCTRLHFADFARSYAAQQTTDWTIITTLASVTESEIMYTGGPVFRKPSNLKNSVVKPKIPIITRL